MTIASFFAFLGIGVFVTTRSAMLAVLPLSERFAAAVSDAERSSLLAAGQAFGALGNPSPQTVGFFFMAIAVLILSIVMMKSGKFGKLTAWTGILTGIFTVIDDISLVLYPALSGVVLGISGLCWVAWWIMVSVGLFRLARREG